MWLAFYDKPTSRAIIKEKPKISPMQAKVLFLLNASGINSLALTAIMHPAENESKKGSRSVVMFEKTNPSSTPISSNIPLKDPIRKDLKEDILDSFRGRLIHEPSGRFWIPIPKARSKALITLPSL